MVAGEVSNDQVILATGSYDHTIRFWSPHNGQCLKIVQHPDSVSLHAHNGFDLNANFIFILIVISK